MEKKGSRPPEPNFKFPTSRSSAFKVKTDIIVNNPFLEGRHDKGRFSREHVPNPPRESA